MNKTAAEMLLKLAQDLEKEAAENTIFACSGCGDSHSMATINNAIAKFAEENPDVNVADSKVTVNDTVSCPNCGHEMEYAPTANSEQYYVPEEDAEEDKPSKQEVESPKEAAVSLDKITKLVSQISKPILNQVLGLINEETAALAGTDSNVTPDKHQGVNFSLDTDPAYNLSPGERQQAKQLSDKLKLAASFDEHEAAGLGAISAKVLFAVLLASTLAAAGGNKHKALSNMTQLINKAEATVNHMTSAPAPELQDYSQTHIDPNTNQPVKTTVHAPGTPETAGAPGSTREASTETILKKASADPKVNLEKLSRYLA